MPRRSIPRHSTESAETVKRTHPEKHRRSKKHTSRAKPVNLSRRYFFVSVATVILAAFLTVFIFLVAALLFSTSEFKFGIFSLLLIAAMATVTTGAFASFYMARSLKKRLTVLTEAIKAMAEGDYRTRIDNAAIRDEIGAVASAFNDMADRLEESRAQEAELERLKRQLITNVSHDLRGPLTSIEGYLAAIEDGLATDPQKAKQYLSVIRNKSRELTQLVEDLLLYSRLESGQYPLNLSSVPCGEWLRETLANYEPDISAAGLSIEAEIPEQTPLIKIDVRKMNQVIANLVQNTIRYARQGTCLQVQLQIVGHEAVLTFTNEGVPIDPTDLPHVFERFYRGKAQNEGIGTGLGMDTATRGGRMQLRSVGSLVETPGFYDHLSGYDNLAIACMARNLPARCITESLHLTNMSQASSKPVGRYSMGMRQRLGISWALLGNPQLLILDEPINGLDPAGVHEVRALLRHLRDERGVTVFLSSHILSEIQQVTDRIGIIHNGRLVAEHDTAGHPAQELEDYFLRLTEGNEIA